MTKTLTTPDVPVPAGASANTSCRELPLRTVDAFPDDIARHAHWVTPALVGVVEYREFRGSLRRPSWIGLRADVSDPSDVVPPA